MAGVYFHIPFCSKACHYCNFHFSTSLHRKPELVRCMVKEIQAFAFRQEYKRPAMTLYFGGGTPSILTASDLQQLFSAASMAFEWNADAEITMEVNPVDCSAVNLDMWKQAGINRLSIGIQSFHQPHLEWMNRSHHAGQSVQSIQAALDAGFQNISIDLIYGLPGQENAQWVEQLNSAFRFPIQHISAYALTVEAGTALHRFIEKKKVPPPMEHAQAEQFLLLQQAMREQGWDSYEISNYCIPGFRSRHNTGYWKGQPYFGFGPSAHSFDGNKTRWWNVANNAIYIDGVNNNLSVSEQELLSDVQRINERIMTGIRRKEGIDFNEAGKQIAEAALTQKQWKHTRQAVERYTESGMIAFKNQRLTLTELGKLYADGIAAELFVQG